MRPPARARAPPLRPALLALALPLLAQAWPLMGDVKLAREIPVCGGAPPSMIPFKVQHSPYDVGAMVGEGSSPSSSEAMRRRALLESEHDDDAGCDDGLNATTTGRRSLLRWTWKRVGCGLKKRMKVPHENDGTGGSRMGRRTISTSGEKSLEKCLRNIKACDASAYEAAGKLTWLTQLAKIPRIPGMLPRLKSASRGGEEDTVPSDGGGDAAAEEWTTSGLSGGEPSPSPTAARRVRGRGTPLRSCALVGNAGHMIKAKYGKYIDNHDVVVRFNTSPTTEFRAHVGTKTSARVLNNSRSVSACCSGNLPEKRGIAMLLWFPSNRVEMRRKCRSRFPGNKLTFLSRRLISGQVSTMRALRNNARRFGLGPFSTWRQLTSGGHAILAMVCVRRTRSMHRGAEREVARCSPFRPTLPLLAQHVRKCQPVWLHDVPAEQTRSRPVQGPHGEDHLWTDMARLDGRVHRLANGPRVGPRSNMQHVTPSDSSESPERVFCWNIDRYATTSSPYDPDMRVSTSPSQN